MMVVRKQKLKKGVKASSFPLHIPLLVQKMTKAVEVNNLPLHLPLQILLHQHPDDMLEEAIGQKLEKYKSMKL